MYELSDLNLHKGDVELEVNLAWGNGKSAGGVVEGALHGLRRLVQLALE